MINWEIDFYNRLDNRLRNWVFSRSKKSIWKKRRRR